MRRGPKRVAIYTRISLDRQGDSVSPERQEELCRQRAEEKGWQVVGVYEDRDQSAYQRTSKRPEWRRLRVAIEERGVDVLMAYSLDRLGRRTRELIELPEYLQQHEVDLVLYDQAVDTTTPQGRAFFGISAVWAQLWSDTTAGKVRDAHLKAAQSGEMHGGPRAFGYRRVCKVCPKGTARCPHKKAVELVPEEAKAIRAMARRILKGESLNSLAGWLNEQNLRTPQGGLWEGPVLSRTMRLPTLAGYRSHNGQLLPGTWKPILDKDTWASVRAELDSRKNPNGKTVPAHLLTGLIRCGRCGERLKAASFTQSNGQPFDRYQCLPRNGRPACGSCAGSKATIDRIVTEGFFDFMTVANLRPVKDAARSLDELEQEITEAEAALSRLTRAHYVERVIDEAAFHETNGELRATLDELRRGRAALNTEVSARARALRPGKRGDIVAWWESAALPERREALARAITAVLLLPAARKGGNRFDTSRVRIIWSGEVYRHAAVELTGAKEAASVVLHPFFASDGQASSVDELRDRLVGVAEYLRDRGSAPPPPWLTTAGAGRAKPRPRPKKRAR